MKNFLEQEHARNGNVCTVEGYGYQYPFSQRQALKEVNLSFHEGEVVAVFGQSGSGKTTLFGSVGGFNHHFFQGGKHEGKIRLFDQAVDEVDIPDLVRNMGWVGQNFRTQLLASKVADAVAFALENQGTEWREMNQRVNELLVTMGLDQIREQEVTGLSGGQGQAVVIASMLAKDPKLMVFDDVASDLDPRGQRQVQEIIEGLKRQGVAMMIVDSAEPKWLLERVADKVLVLENGAQVYFGPPEGVQHNEALMRSLGLRQEQVRFRKARNGTAAVEFDNVSFAYGNQEAVRNVSGWISQGSVTGIIGHNGSGKSTLLKMIGGLLDPKTGEVVVEGQKPRKLSAQEAVRKVAYLPQSSAGLFFTQTVAEELVYTPKILGIEATITPAMIGLTGLEQEHPEFLSAGQRQRLALGNALSSRPDVLLMDEPTKGLNQGERRELVSMVLGLQEQGTTIVMVSHDWHLIGQVAENVMVMDHGEMVRTGATEEVLQDKEWFEKLGMPLPW